MKKIIVNKNKKYLISKEERSRNLWWSCITSSAVLLTIVLAISYSFGQDNPAEVVQNDNYISSTLLVTEKNPSEDIMSVEEVRKQADYPKFETAGLKKYRVTKVVDGDTIYVEGISTRIRLIGVNTPETVSSSSPIECYGPEASFYLKNLLLGEDVFLESDIETGDTDIYGRPLRYVYHGNKNVNYEIIKNGYGVEASYGNDYRYRSAFLEAESSAREHSVGLWSPSTCNGIF